MIIIKLSKIAERKELSQSEICKRTGIRPGTINAYYHGFVRRINVKDLDKLCKVLKCRLSQLIEYIPDKK